MAIESQFLLGTEDLPLRTINAAFLLSRSGGLPSEIGPC